ncbi:MAG: hypothetical protein IKK39_02945, partial [Thermoguttaceae bacterium]|nr:hypothetical protein [Thermoguttaceae bacterium]
MKKLDVILSSAFLFAAATANVDSLAFGQGFGGYVAPTQPQSAPSVAPQTPLAASQPSQTPSVAPTAPTSPTSQPLQIRQSSPTPQTLQTPQTTQTNATRPLQRAATVDAAAQSARSTQALQTTRSPQISQSVSSAYSAQNARSTNAHPAASAQPVRVAQIPPVSRPAQPTQPTQPTPTVQSLQSNQAAQPGRPARPAATSAQTGSASVLNAFVPPPAHYKLSENEQLKLNEFLTHWENFGKGIKQVSCDVHMMEFDGGVLQQDSKKPVAHNWGLFRFKAPNQLLYHIKGEFSYANVDSGGTAVWKEGQNELKIVLDGKSLTQYDYENKKAVVYPLAEDEQNIDLTMDNGQFPLFFVAKAETLKNRFYLRL